MEEEKSQKSSPSRNRDDAAESEDEEEIPEHKLTKHGYKKDGFVIDDDSDDLCEQEYTGSELTDEEYYYSDE